MGLLGLEEAGEEEGVRHSRRWRWRWICIARLLCPRGERLTRQGMIDGRIESMGRTFGFQVNPMV